MVLKRTLLVLFASLIVITVFELILRFFGYPYKTFVPLFPGERGLYPESASMQMDWGSLPYTVKTNSSFAMCIFRIKPLNFLISPQMKN